MSVFNRMRLVFWGVAGLLGLIALGFILSGISQVANASASTNWSQTSGRVITSEVKFSEQHSSREQSISYIANIVYEYAVNDKTLTSQQIKFGMDNASANTAQQLVNKYPVGSTVTVHYAPADPRNAVLEPGVTAGSFGSLVIAGLVLVGAVIFGGVGFWLGGVGKGVASGEYQVLQSGGIAPDGTRRATILRSTPKRDANGEAKTSFSEQAIPFAIMLLLAIIGSAVLYVGLSDARDAFASSSWSHAQGTVVSYFVEQRESTDSNNNVTITYTPRVVYRYQVNGVTYLGDRVTFEDVGTSFGTSGGYATGQSVTVFYSPDDPNRAVLKTGANIQSFWLLGVGACFAGLGIPSVLGMLLRLIRGKSAV